MTSSSWIVITLAMIGQAGVTWTMQGLPIVYPFIQGEFGLSRAQIGIITSALFTGGLTTMFLGGWLTDRFGVKRVMVVSLVLASAFTFGFSTVHYFHALLMMVFLAGLAEGPGYPATSQAVLHRVPVRILGLAMSAKQTGTALSGAVSAMLLPTIAVSLGWRPATVGLAAVILLTGVAFLLFYPGDWKGEVPRSSESLLDSLVLLKQNQPFQAALVWGLIFTACQFILVTYFMLFLIEHLRIPPVVAGGYFALMHVTSVGVRMLWGGATDYLLGGRRVGALALMGGFTTTGLVLVATASAETDPFVFTLLSVVLGASMFSWQGVFTVLVGELAGHSQSGSIYGLVGTVVRLSQIAVPPLFGLLVDVSQSYALAWSLVAVMPLVANLVLFRFCEEPCNLRSSHR